MGGDRQSEQRHEAPTTPDTDNTEEPDRGNQADDQSNEVSVASQQQKRGRFLGRLRKRRSTDSAEQAGASTEQPAKKPKIGLLGIVITALVGFFFGIGSNQVTDYVKLATVCADALSEYSAGLPHFAQLLDAKQDKQNYDQFFATLGQYNTFIGTPKGKVLHKCPINSGSQYLNSNDVKRWKADSNQLWDCWMKNKCSSDNGYSYVLATANSTEKLEGEAAEVSQWGLLRRAWYEITHLY